jgi:hypothetical protein
MGTRVVGHSFLSPKLMWIVDQASYDHWIFWRQVKLLIFKYIHPLNTSIPLDQIIPHRWVFRRQVSPLRVKPF